MTFERKGEDLSVRGRDVGRGCPAQPGQFQMEFQSRGIEETTICSTTIIRNNIEKAVTSEIHIEREVKKEVKYARNEIRSRNGRRRRQRHRY